MSAGSDSTVSARTSSLGLKALGAGRGGGAVVDDDGFDDDCPLPPEAPPELLLAVCPTSGSGAS